MKCKKYIYLLSIISVCIFFCFCRSSSQVSVVEVQQPDFPILHDTVIGSESSKLDREYNCPSNTVNPYTLQYIAFLSDSITETFEEMTGKIHRWKTTRYINYPHSHYVKYCEKNMLIALGNQEAKDLRCWLLKNQCKRTESIAIDKSMDNGYTCIVLPDSLCIIVLNIP